MIYIPEDDYKEMFEHYKRAIAENFPDSYGRLSYSLALFFILMVMKKKWII
ncbi:MAG: hypothetical protein LBL16_00220 [Endomicrobium sp.]|nr:hypothetical protein [Endomicrobium sp.]